VKVFITGVSSFTGCHIARAFCESKLKNSSVFGVLTRKLSDYSVLERQRLEYSLVQNWIEEASFGSKNFINSILKIKPDVFINHGASIKGYREKNFDVHGCVEKAIFNLDDVVGALSFRCHFIHSGSVFESDNERGLSAYSPYGLAKALIWEEILKYNKKIKITKIVIPDPVGVYENPDRLGPVLFRKWNLGKGVDLKNPDVIQDRLPAPWLARKYCEATEESNTETCNIVRPSAFCSSNLDWVKKLAFYFEKKTSKKCSAWNLLPNFDTERKNTETVSEVFSNEECERFFDEYSEWLLK
jgi:hypothetical protein